MQALSVRQPYAILIAIGRKTLEVRSKATNVRGPVLICASQNPAQGLAGYPLAVVDLHNCRPMKPSDVEDACVDYTPGYYVWEMRVIKMLIKPQLPRVKGSLGFYHVDLPGLREGDPWCVTK